MLLSRRNSCPSRRRSRRPRGSTGNPRGSARGAQAAASEGTGVGAVPGEFILILVRAIRMTACFVHRQTRMSGTSSSEKTRHEVLKLVVPGEYFGELGTYLFIDSVLAIRLTAFVFFFVHHSAALHERSRGDRHGGERRRVHPRARQGRLRHAHGITRNGTQPHGQG